MPFSKANNRRIYITALIISFLLIVGSIYLHLKQKTHLGRMSFNLDRDRIKPTSGVDITTVIDDYDSKYIKATEITFNTNENASPEDDYTFFKSSREFDTDEDNDDNTDVETNEDTDEDKNEYGDEYIVDDIVKEVEGVSEKPDSKMDSLIPNDSGSCLRCLCMTVNECRPTFCGSGNPCGLFRISKSYWIDSGKPTIAGGSIDNEDQDYLTCANDATCSSTAIRQYYNRYKRDCNKDGTFDCKDIILLHILGPSGCLIKNLGTVHENRMRKCFLESNLSYFSYSSEDNY